MPRTTTEKLDSSINVPMPRDLKRRIIARAKQCNARSYTYFAREILRKHMEQDRAEKQLKCGKAGQGSA